MIAVGGALCQAFEDDRLQRTGDGGVQFCGRNGLSVDNLVRHRRHGLAGERLLSGSHPIEDDAQRKQVGAAIDGRAGKLLGGHERRRSQELTAGGDLTGNELGNPKIGNLRPLVSVCLARSEQDVRGLDIAVNDAMAVRVPEGFGHLLSDLADAIQRRPLALFHGIGESLAIDKFHHQKRHALVFANVEDGHNSGMGQSARGARLAIEALAEFVGLYAGQGRCKDGLQGDNSIHRGVARPEYTAHRAVAQLIENLIPRDVLRDRHNLS